MNIQLFIITYNNNADLNTNLESLYSSDFGNHDVHINIISNHSSCVIDNKFIDKITLYDNKLRPDFSTGHLARNWNQAIINGFKNLNNPDCDIVITCQDDTIFDNTWLEQLLELHKKYNFVQMGAGDNFCSYLPEAVKIVGLWDERFCNIGHQEADYFIRCLIYNKTKTCLNDHAHGRLLNNVKNEFCRRTKSIDFKSEHHMKSWEHHSLSRKILDLKWNGLASSPWTQDLINNPPKQSSLQNWIFYPYFEKDILDLSKKGYVI